MMMMPLENLRNLNATLANFNEFESLVKIFLQHTLPEQPDTGAPSGMQTRSKTMGTLASRCPSKRKRSALGSDDDYDPAEAANIQRSTTEAKKPLVLVQFLERDSHACKIKLTSNPQKCHFVPFASDSTTASLELLVRVIPSYGFLFPDEQPDMPALITDSVGCSDKSWNMVCLNSQLHTWWSKSFFGIKCVGITPEEDIVNSKVWLEFHWMSRRTPPPPDPTRKISIETTPVGDAPSEDDDEESKAARFIKGPGVYYGDATEVNPDPLDIGLVTDFVGPWGRPLLSGHRFQITLASEDAPKMKTMVDLQWACVNIANMSGAASWPAFTGEDDDDDDDAFADAHVSAWLKETEL